ncbi:MAG TPA: L-aspartate oxidase, partial [Pilimelia sp.]|nr:L-aspartate oxidase [Pilimelia sp.]
LDAAAAELVDLARGAARPRTASWEATNLVTVAATLVAAAYARRETRGCHWREDFPDASPQWRGHLAGALGPAGRPVLTWTAA